MKIVLISLVLAFVGCTKKSVHTPSRMPSSTCIQPTIACHAGSKCTPATALSFSKIDLRTHPTSRELRTSFFQKSPTITHLVIERGSKDYYFVRPGMETNKESLKGWTDTNGDNIIQESEVTAANLPDPSIADLTNAIHEINYYEIDRYGNSIQMVTQA